MATKTERLLLLLEISRGLKQVGLKSKSGSFKARQYQRPLEIDANLLCLASFPL